VRHYDHRQILKNATTKGLYRAGKDRSEVARQDISNRFTQSEICQIGRVLNNRHYTEILGFSAHCLNREVGETDVSAVDKSIYTARKLVAVYMAAGALFLACVVAGFVVLNIASFEANRFSMATERKLVSAEVSHFVERAIREQGELAYWDDAKQHLALTTPPNTSFAREYVASWFIGELGFSDAALVGPDGTVKLSAADGHVETEMPDATLATLASDLVRKARALYAQRRVKVGDKFMVYAEGSEVNPHIQAYAYRLFDGVPTLVIAQVMLAEEPQFASRDGEEVVFLSAKPLSDDVVSQTATRLALSAVKIVPADTIPADQRDAAVSMPDTAGEPSLVITWEPRSPREGILQATLPVGAIMIITLMAILFFIVHRHAATLKTLTVSEATNRFLATHDSLTGLPNRKKFEDALEGACSLAAHRCFAVMYIDLDRFKAVNDTYGHAAGDAVLLNVARRLDAAVGTRGTVARMGGDEFVALITADLATDELHWFANEIIADVSKPIAYGDTVLEVGASIGIAIAPQNGTDPRTIMQSADAALYASKENGRGQVRVWESAA
jgi:diguanylate cyclase (GGDEF)-like protein